LKFRIFHISALRVFGAAGTKKPASWQVLSIFCRIFPFGLEYTKGIAYNENKPIENVPRSKVVLKILAPLQNLPKFAEVAFSYLFGASFCLSLLRK
jgi:hypothetical protein